jgi:hypothetical protein
MQLILDRMIEGLFIMICALTGALIGTVTVGVMF